MFPSLSNVYILLRLFEGHDNYYYIWDSGWLCKKVNTILLKNLLYIYNGVVCVVVLFKYNIFVIINILLF